MGILGFFSCFALLGILFGVIGIIQVTYGKGRVRGAGLAVVGIILAVAWQVAASLLLISLPPEFYEKLGEWLRTKFGSGGNTLETVRFLFR